MTGRFPIEDVTPSVSCGRYPAKAVVGELVPISAVSYREGHNTLGVNVVWQGPDGQAEPFTRMQPGTPGLDQWHAVIKPDVVGRWTFTIEAFDDFVTGSGLTPIVKPDRIEAAGRAIRSLVGIGSASA